MRSFGELVSARLEIVKFNRILTEYLYSYFLIGQVVSCFLHNWPKYTSFPFSMSHFSMWTYKHVYIYIYIYMCLCVCVCVDHILRHSV